MKVVISPFALWGIQAQVGSDMGAGIETAVVHYARRLKSKTPPLPLPKFRLADCDEDRREQDGRVFHIAVDNETEKILRREAFRRGASLDCLVDHTIMVFLADLERPGSHPSTV
jgi:hypothetical protein